MRSGRRIGIILMSIGILLLLRSLIFVGSSTLDVYSEEVESAQDVEADIETEKEEFEFGQEVVEEEQHGRELEPETTVAEEEMEENPDEEEMEEEPDDNAMEEEVEEQFVPLPVDIRDVNNLGDWTNYHGIAFENAVIYDSVSGGALAVGGNMQIYRDYDVGSTYTSEYDSTRHIGEFKNQNGYPALLFGGHNLTIGDSVTSLNVFGGPITMNEMMLEKNNSLANGFIPQNNSHYETADQDGLDRWFDQQQAVAKKTSQMVFQGNNIRISLNEFSSGAYLDYGPEYFQNKYFKSDGKAYEKVLFITVETGNILNFGQWWPELSLMYIDVNWALDYDLVVYSFPNAVNVTMNASTFSVQNLTHWSTTVDAWTGGRGMEERLALAEKVVYNFPKAESIEATEALIQGSILAPQATFTGIGSGANGHIYGHIIVKNFVAMNNFTIHSFNMTHLIYDIANEIINTNEHDGSLSLRSYLYLRNNPTTTRVGDAGYIIRNAAGEYYDGYYEFTDQIEGAYTFRTSVDTDLMIRGLPVGSYTLQQVDAGSGFAINTNDDDNEYTFFETGFSITEDEKNVTKLRYVSPVTRSVTLQKTNEYGQGIAGCSFALIREGDEYEDALFAGIFESGEDGYFTIGGLPKGVYHLIEYDSPPEYGLVDDIVITIYWDAEKEELLLLDDEGQALTGTDAAPVVIRDAEGGSGNTLLVLKYKAAEEDEQIMRTLAGAHFELYRLNTSTSAWEQVTADLFGQSFEIITNQFGYYRLDNLPAGRFRLVETVAPPGYEVINKYQDEDNVSVFPNGFSDEFVLDDEQNAYWVEIENGVLRTSLTITLMGNEQPIAGAAFRLERLLQDGKTWVVYIYSQNTNNDGKLQLVNLEAGNYRLTQMGSGTGFQPVNPNSVIFDIAFDAAEQPGLNAFYNDAEVTAESSPVSLSTEEGLGIRIQNRAAKNSFSIYKIDGDYTVDEDQTHHVTFLEDAVFRLQRRTDGSQTWADYGDEFRSQFQYDEQGQPVNDNLGNHVAKADFNGGLISGEYRIIETHPPAGYTSYSDISVTLDDGTSGYQIYQFSVTAEMAEAARAISYTARDYADVSRTEFSFRKVELNESTTGLPLAEFALYSCNERHQHDELVSDDSCWSQNTPINKVSDENGRVSFKGLGYGEYMLVESKAPKGYQKPNGQWHLVIAQEDTVITAIGNSILDFVVSTEDGVDYLLPNRRKYLLPLSGGAGRLIFYIIGASLLGAAVIMYKKKRGKRDEIL